LFLPVSEKPAQTPSVGFEVQSSKSKKNETILLVEDDPAVRQMASSVLKSQGYKVLEADSGPSAFKMWDQRQKEVDLLLTDIRMPEGITGWEVVKRLRQDRPQLKAVAMSGYAPDQPPDLDIAFLSKPYQPQMLLKTVSDTLNSIPLNKG
jgi:CheY-like chemotaxis protein